jgi:hypothetical protein
MVGGNSYIAGYIGHNWLPSPTPSQTHVMQAHPIWYLAKGPLSQNRWVQPLSSAAWPERNVGIGLSS